MRRTPVRVGWIVSLLTAATVAVAGQGSAPSGGGRDTAVIDAVRADDLTALRRLVQQGADVHAAQADGTTALHWSAYRGDAEAARLLIGAGATIEATTRYGITPLALACSKGAAAVVETLLDAGADPNTLSGEGETVLMTAARTGNLAVLEALVTRGADVNAKEGWRGQTALMWAAADDHPAALRFLVEQGAEIHARSNGGFTALLFAVRGGRSDAVHALLDLGANVDDTIRPLVEPEKPVGFGFFETGPQVGTSALVLAITNAHFELARDLLGKGADPNADDQGWTALHQVAYTRRPNIGKGLAPPEPTGSVGSFDLAKALLAAGANVNAVQSEEIRDGNRNILRRVGATPFLLAAKHADVPLMRLFAQHGADPRVATERGASPLMVAAGVGIFNLGESAGTNDEALEAVKLAYDLGDTDVNAADAGGYTALHGAALRGANPIIEFLVKHGARLDATTTREGWTPLRIASGVLYTGTVKRADHTAELLLRLMQERGLSAEAEAVNSVAEPPPRRR